MPAENSEKYKPACTSTTKKMVVNLGGLQGYLEREKKEWKSIDYRGVVVWFTLIKPSHS